MNFLCSAVSTLLFCCLQRWFSCLGCLIFFIVFFPSVLGYKLLNYFRVGKYLIGFKFFYELIRLWVSPLSGSLFLSPWWYNFCYGNEGTILCRTYLIFSDRRIFLHRFSWNVSESDFPAISNDCEAKEWLKIYSNYFYCSHILKSSQIFCSYKNYKI